MRVSHQWLKQYVKFDLGPVQLAERLTMLGLEVEGIEDLGKMYEGFVVGKILECSRHPNADRLTVCMVSVKRETLQIVCGAPNVAAGQKVAVGLIGATVPRNQHDTSGKPFVLSHVKLRGIDSFGMICSEYELGLGPDAQGILVLDGNAKVGQPLSTYLGMDDITYEIGVTPNRPDLLSHIGVAREIGVITGRLPVVPKPYVREVPDRIAKHFSVKIEDTKHCRRFAVRIVRGVTIAPSPPWLQQRLRAVGLRPRNNVVDVTNFVMLECGQPLHAFDYALLQNNTIVVRQAAGGTPFATLDGKEHTLPAGAVMVCDGERQVSIAGVMGGENSEIGDTTTDVVIESAYWTPSSIRRTAKLLGLSTDASQRFERGADINVVPYALDRATRLIADLAGGKVLKGKIDVYPHKVRSKKISLRPDRVNSSLGTSISRKDMIRSLKLLGISVASQKPGQLTVQVPSYRVDLEREIDLIEEIARVYGYDKIDDRTTSNADFTQSFPIATDDDVVRNVLVGFAFQEAITNSMQDRASATLATREPVELMNPLGKEMACMRSSLIPGLLEVAARNQSFGNTNLRLFEIGHVFEKDGSKKAKFVENILEVPKVGLLMMGFANPNHWSERPRLVDLFDLKGFVSNLLDRVALDKWKFIYYSTPNTLAENPIRIEINGTYAGYFGKASKDVASGFGIDIDCCICELDLASLVCRTKPLYNPLPKYPKVLRDIAFTIDAHTPAEIVEQTIKEAGSDLLRRIELFDMYEGENLPEGRKSLAFSLELQSLSKTLTDGEIDTEVAGIVAHVVKKLGASLRSS